LTSSLSFFKVVAPVGVLLLFPFLCVL